MIIFRIAYKILNYFFGSKVVLLFEVRYKVKNVIKQTVIPSNNEKTMLITIASFENVELKEIEILTIKTVK